MTSPVVAGVKRSYATMAYSWDGQSQSSPAEPRPTSRPFPAEGRDPVYLPPLHATTPTSSAGLGSGGKAPQHLAVPCRAISVPLPRPGILADASQSTGRRTNFRREKSPAQ
jgi:hypothetical protein